jgi:hypothetical protein
MHTPCPVYRALLFLLRDAYGRFIRLYRPTPRQQSRPRRGRAPRVAAAVQLALF